MRGDSIRKKRGTEIGDLRSPGVLHNWAGKGTASLSLRRFPAWAVRLRFAPDGSRDEAEHLPEIRRPASLRSDRVRHQPGMLFGFSPEQRSPSSESASNEETACRRSPMTASRAAMLSTRKMPLWLLDPAGYVGQVD
jgi:hypothetical protein